MMQALKEFLDLIAICIGYVSILCVVVFALAYLYHLYLNHEEKKLEEVANKNRNGSTH